MTAGKSLEEAKWEEVKDYMGKDHITLGPVTSYQLKHTPRRLLFAWSRYKFAAKLLGENKNVLEIGCNEGFGTLLIAEFAKSVTAIDIDAEAIAEAEKSFGSEKVNFFTADILTAELGEFDGVVSFDVIEHIYPENEDRFFQSICQNLKKQGICVIGTPNKTFDPYTSEVTRLGHVNMYTWERLKESMEKYFEQVFIFSSNDEVIHTGFYPMAIYLIAVGINKK